MHGINTDVLQYSEGWIQADPGLINRAALFGDGVFETMIFLHGKIRFGQEHEERLNLGLKLLKIRPSLLTVRQLEEYMKQNYNQENCFRIRWNVYRGGLGKYSPLSNHSENLVMIQPQGDVPTLKSSAYISPKIRISPSPWSHCKTLNSLPYVMANVERMETGMDEVILLSDGGFVSEAGAANIFWKKGKVFYTPSINCNCIAGVGRRKILESLESAGISCLEGEFFPKELLSADQVFTSNVTGISYIASIERQPFETTPLPEVERVFDLFR